MSLRSAAVAALLVAGFAGSAAAKSPPGPPWPEMVSPYGITLRWYPDEVPEAAAHQVAAAHCAAVGLGASIAEVQMDGSAEIASYRCL